MKKLLRFGAVYYRQSRVCPIKYNAGGRQKSLIKICRTIAICTWFSSSFLEAKCLAISVALENLGTFSDLWKKAPKRAQLNTTA